jgi:hypothetical protein
MQALASIMKKVELAGAKAAATARSRPLTRHTDPSFAQVSKRPGVYRGGLI